MEGILVIISFMFLLALNIAMWFRNPNTNFLDWYVGKGLRFEKSQLPAFTRVLSVVGIVSAVLGYLLSQSYRLTLEFVAINLAIMGVCGVNLILYRRTQER